jgi:hypothetical protein
LSQTVWRRQNRGGGAASEGPHGRSPFDFQRCAAQRFTGPGAGGNQAFHIGGGGGHAGDVLATYDGATDITNINLYVNNDATVDGRLLLTGDHHNLNSWDLIA